MNEKHEIANPPQTAHAPYIDGLGYQYAFLLAHTSYTEQKSYPIHALPSTLRNSSKEPGSLLLANMSSSELWPLLMRRTPTLW